MPATIKQILIDAKCSQSTAAERVGISSPALNLLINRNIWPARDPDGVRQRLRDLLLDLDVDKSEVDGLIAALGTLHTPSIFDRFKNQRAPQIEEEKKEENPMLIGKQSLTSATRRAFNIPMDPFAEDLPGPEGVFLSPSIRYARETMLFTAKNGGFLAVTGESGSGKTTLYKELQCRVANEQLPIIIIEPYVLGMEEDERNGGKVLKIQHVVDAILEALGERPAHSVDRKYRQVHKALTESTKNGNHHCVVIEESHDIPPATLKHLKRLYELKVGFKRLLSIIILGQQELQRRLTAANHTIREVVQRIDVVKLEPLDDLQGYVEHRLKTVGLTYSKIFAPDALDALKELLTDPAEKGRMGKPCWYPLVVGNVLNAAMNIAAEIGETLVTGDCVRRVRSKV